MDIGTLRSPRMTADGRMVVDALISRTGVYVYAKADGSAFREYRPDSTVFDAKAMASFELKPLTDDHPEQAPADVQSNRAVARGLVLEGVKRDGKHVAATFLIDSAELQSKMKSGKMQVSCGYECDLDETPGISPEGERYDAVQKNIRGNHVAIVDYGRAGSAAVKMDNADGAYTICAGEPSGAPAAKLTPKGILMDELQKQLAASMAEAAAQKARADQAEKDRDAARKDAADAKAAAAQAEGARDSAKKDADDAKAAAEKSRTDAAAAMPAAVAARVSVERGAASVLGADAKVGEKSICDADSVSLKLATVKKVDGVDVDMKAKSEAYLDGRFDACVAKAAKGKETLGSINLGADGKVVVDSDDSETAARAKMVAAGSFKGAK